MAGACLPIIRSAEKAMTDDHGGGMDPLQPSAALLVKIGSLVVHLEEAMSTKGHHFDKAAIQSLQSDPEVKQWFEDMTMMALLPVKR